MHLAESESDTWKARILAVITFFNGILSIFLILSTRLNREALFFRNVLPFGLHHLSRSLTLILGFLLIYFSFTLFQRKKTAWWLAVLISAFSILAHLGRMRFSYAALAPLLMLVFLVAWRRAFVVRSESTGVIQGLGLIFLILALATTYGTIGFWLLDVRDFGIDFGIADSVVRTLKEFFFLGNPDIFPYTRHARWFLGSFQWLGALSLILAVYSLFKPVKYRLVILPHERELAKNLLKKYSRSADDYFKLSSEKEYFFSKNVEGFVAYKNISGVSMVLNDPTGPSEKIEEISKQFLQFCFENGWASIFLNVLPDFLESYKKLGLRSLKIGEEAVVNLNRFCGETLGKKSFRKIKNRFDREGYKTFRYLPPNSDELINEIEEVSREWLTLPERKERSFVVGRFGREYVKNSPIFAARNSAGKIIAFVNQIPVYKKDEATIDMMRHRVGAPNNTMEYLFLELFKALKNDGYEKFILGLAPLSGIGEKPDSGIEEKALRLFSRYLNRFFSYKGLRLFKEKFEPDWEERFVVYKGNLLKIVFVAYRIIEG